MLDKVKMANNIDSVMDEVAILNMLDHPNIVKHLETYDEINLFYIGKYTLISKVHTAGFAV